MAARAQRLDRRFRLALVAGLVLVLAVVALPALAANPDTGPAGGNAERGPVNAESSPGPGAEKAKKAKKARVPKTPITVSGTVAAVTDEDGNPAYQLTDGGTTWSLDAGPAWFHGDNHPLEAYVGKQVTIDGEAAEGSTELEVATVDGTALRAPGRPPWAGGWKRVGKAHPGWSQEKADRTAEKAERMKAKFGDCFPPGKCKDAAAGE